MTTRPEGIADALAAEWGHALDRLAQRSPRWSVLFSGGLDSSLVAWGLKARVDVELVSVGVEGSADLTDAETGAKLLELPWKLRVLSTDEVLQAARLLDDRVPNESPSRAVQVGIALALDACRTTHVACGQGADELFLGYAHFERLSPQQAAEQRRTDLHRLLDVDWPVSAQLAAQRERNLASPFLDSDFISRVLAVPFDELHAGPGRKPLLRTLAVGQGLPAPLAQRPKKAFQYGSGIARALRGARRRATP